jgi:hypothetical protein
MEEVKVTNVTMSASSIKRPYLYIIVSRDWPLSDERWLAAL